LGENVADGETGFVVPRRQPTLMAARLEQLALDGELRRRLGASARRRAVMHFDVGDQIDAFERFYGAVAAAKHADAR
jgi:colanic acid/amylovoran biosynthesis glycosyltransferase